MIQIKEPTRTSAKLCCGAKREFGMSHLPLTEKYLHALRAVARGEVFRTYNSLEFKLTGPCSSRLLWSLSRMDLIADPPGGPLCRAVTACCSLSKGWKHCGTRNKARRFAKRRHRSRSGKRVRAP